MMDLIHDNENPEVVNSKRKQDIDENEKRKKTKKRENKNKLTFSSPRQSQQIVPII